MHPGRSLADFTLSGQVSFCFLAFQTDNQEEEVEKEEVEKEEEEVEKEEEEAEEEKEEEETAAACL